MSTNSQKIDRLTRKIELLESMFEDRSRQAYYEATRRSTINAMLELSLKAQNSDNFLLQVLDILFSVEALSIENKGAIILFEDKSGRPILRAQNNLPEDLVNSICNLDHNPSLTNKILSGDILYSPDNFEQSTERQPYCQYYVPIRTFKKCYGIIVLFIAKNISINNEDRHFFTSISDICAGTLERMDYSQQIIDYQENLEKQVAEQTQNLLEEKERLAVTLRSIGDGVITTDLDGSVILVNKIAEHLTGWEQQTAVGLPVEDIFHIINEITGNPCENPVSEVLISGEIVGLNRDIALISKDGKKYSIENSGAPIFDKKSKMIGTVLVFRDVTETRTTAEQLLKVQKLESVGVLAGGIAHDFNNILGAILGNIQLAGMSFSQESEEYSILQDAKDAALRAKGLTQQLLTFAKGGDPVKVTASIGKTIIDSANFVLHGSPVSCQFNIPDDLWLVDIDSGQISQVIQNLIINAKNAMPEGGKIQITCSNISDLKTKVSLGERRKPYIKIIVQDEGCGVEENHLKNIFDPYFTTREEGNGLGLAVTHSIIRKHNGHIAVDSKLGKGTTFTIYLPASEQQTLEVSPPPKAPEEPNIIKAKILIMDDEVLLQEAAKQLLSLLGHDVLLAGDGQEAIEIFKQQNQEGTPIDVIIMDLTIPGGMGGKDAIKEILKIDPEAKVLVSSGYSNDPVMAQYKEFGFKAAIAKPFLLEALSDVLTDVMI